MVLTEARKLVGDLVDRIKEVVVREKIAGTVMNYWGGKGSQNYLFETGKDNKTYLTLYTGKERCNLKKGDIAYINIPGNNSHQVCFGNKDYRVIRSIDEGRQ